MNTNQISSANDIYQASQKTDAYRTDSTRKATDTTDKKSTTSDEAAVYEKSSKKSKGYTTLSKDNQAVIRQLKADAEQRAAQLRSLVESMISKQNKTYQTGTLTDSKMFELLRSGKLEVSAEVREQAAKDIAEDGYWGVEQTSERLFSFAKAISGGDKSKVDTLLKAMEKGFKLATKTFGDKLPDICQKTLDSATEKLKAWAKESESDTATEDAAATEFANQAASSELAK